MTRALNMTHRERNAPRKTGVMPDVSLVDSSAVRALLLLAPNAWWIISLGAARAFVAKGSG